MGDVVTKLSLAEMLGGHVEPVHVLLGKALDGGDGVLESGVTVKLVPLFLLVAFASAVAVPVSVILVVPHSLA